MRALRSRCVAVTVALLVGSLGAVDADSRAPRTSPGLAEAGRRAPRSQASGPVLESGERTRASFGASGAHLTLGEHEGTLAVVALGRSGALRDLEGTASPHVSGDEVRIDHGVGVTEWWRALPSGLEHGVTIAERPAGEGEVTVEVELSGALSAHSISDEAVELRGEHGEVAGRYAGLVVVDAAGARMPARMSVDGERIVLAFDDARAEYPLVVDPLVTTQEAVLLSPARTTSDSFGRVAISADGTRALVGAWGAMSVGTVRGGTARVYLRTGTTWAEEANLFASDGEDGDALGLAVALSGDGTRALLGAYNDVVGGLRVGTARVFVRTGTTWAEEATLSAPGGEANDRFGLAVALSYDGSRALVGANGDDSPRIDAGSALVFARTATTWTYEASLVAADGGFGDVLGSAVALSGSGDVALVGASGDDTPGGNDAGSARVFVRAGTSWAEETALVQPDGQTGDRFGGSVALSRDGVRALVGAPSDTTVGGLAAGSGHLFLRTGTTWAREAAFVPSTAAPNDHFSVSVALSPDGTRALFGSDGDDTAAGTNAGSAHLFVRTGMSWTEEAQLLAPDAAANDTLGYSVAISDGERRAVLGAIGDDGYLGSARVFTITTSANGTPCARSDTCTSGFCVDGFCCGSACGGGAADCQACSAALGATTNGTCGLFPATTTCRASAGICDVAEACTGASGACPPDAFVGATTVCRAAGGVCDVPETCSATAAACPPDARVANGTMCRGALGPCDRDETCDGASVACPGDTLAPAGAVCRAPGGGCDVPESCDGASVACPGDVLAPASTVCQARLPGNVCDVDDVCTGASPVCPPSFASATTSCGPPATEICDAPDHCTGTSADCMAEYLSGIECRPVSGVCDVADVCSGSSPTCPPDAALSTAIICRPSTGGCDPAETCDGVATSCPSDVATCGSDAGASDAGAAGDASVGEDATVGAPDAGGAVAVAGCACVLSARLVPAPTLLVIGMLAGALVRRARRRRGRA